MVPNTNCVGQTHTEPLRTTQRTVVVDALPAPSLHQTELHTPTACTFSKDVILVMFVKKDQPSVVIVAPLPIS